jgi:hypothetical protein
LWVATSGITARGQSGDIQKRHHLPDFFLRSFLTNLPQHIDAVNESRQRVSQLVTEHGEKLIPSLMLAGEVLCASLDGLDGEGLSQVFEAEKDVRR